MWYVTRPSPTPKSLLRHHQKGLGDKWRLLGPCCRRLAYEDVVCAWHYASHITWTFLVNPHNNSIHRDCYYCEGSERLSGMPKKLAGAGLKSHNLMWERIVLYCLYHVTTNYKCCLTPQNGGMSEEFFGRAQWKRGRSWRRPEEQKGQETHMLQKNLACL